LAKLANLNSRKFLLTKGKFFCNSCTACFS